MDIKKLNKKRIIKNLIIPNFFLLLALVIVSYAVYLYFVERNLQDFKNEQKREAGFVCDMIQKYYTQDDKEVLADKIQKYELDRDFCIQVSDTDNKIIYSSISMKDCIDFYKYSNGQYVSNNNIYFIKTLKLKSSKKKNLSVKIVIVSKSVLYDIKTEIINNIINKGVIAYLIVAILLSIFILLISHLNYKSFQNRILGNLMKGVNDGFIICDSAGNIIFANDSFLKIFNKKLNQVLGGNIVQFYSNHQDDDFFKIIKDHLDRYGVWSGEIARTFDNDIKCFTKTKVSIVTIKKQSKAKYYVVIYEDRTDFHMQKIDILKLQLYDTFSGLPNRAYAKKYLEKLIDYRMAFVYMNICMESFDEINKNFGFEIVNKIYLQYLEKLKSILGKNVFISRIDSKKVCAIFDAFEVSRLNIVLKNISDISQIPFYIYSEKIFINSSVSIFPYLDMVNDIENVFNAKHENIEQLMQGESFIEISRLIENIEAERNEMIKLMKEAIKKSEFYLSYQPRIDMKNNCLAGAEALIRWNNAEYGNISPMYFIPMAERCGYIDEITEWTIKELCSQLRIWKDKYKRIVPVSINISPQSIKKENFMNKLIIEVDKNNLSRSDIEIEITERVIDSACVDCGTSINNLSREGFKIYIDNFGTGNSKMDYLRNLNITAIKIDREFIKNYPDKDDGTIAKLIIDMSKSLDISIIGEGIETVEQINFLKGNNCNVIQGYYFYKPLIAKVYEKILVKYLSFETQITKK